VRILFAALHNGYYRNLDSVIEELARRGHHIHLGPNARIRLSADNRSSTA
jgi:hypothetical protein